MLYYGINIRRSLCTNQILTGAWGTHHLFIGIDHHRRMHRMHTHAQPPQEQICIYIMRHTQIRWDVMHGETRVDKFICKVNVLE
jgi:hypothetical protein